MKKKKKKKKEVNHLNKGQTKSFKFVRLYHEVSECGGLGLIDFSTLPYLTGHGDFEDFAYLRLGFEVNGYYKIVNSPAENPQVHILMWELLKNPQKHF